MDTLTQPILEQVMPMPGTSFLVKHYPEPAKRANKLPKWHYHPELELVYVNGGHGRRHVGSHVSHFTDGELILVGANLPHMGFTDRMTQNRKETVVQFARNFPNYDFLELPEMREVKSLMSRALNGLSFTGRTKTVQGARLERLIELDPLSRMLLLIDILNQLALSEECESLNVDGFHLEIETHGYDRYRDVQQYVAEHFRSDLSLDAIAGVANMSVPAFCRYFKKTTGKTFIRYVNDFRIVFACKLLGDGHGSIQEVAYDSGFNSVSQFNRAFRKYIGQSPTEYRKQLRMTVISPVDDF